MNRVDFANPNSHHKLPTSHVVSLPHIKIPKPTSQKITRNEETEMRVWAKMWSTSPSTMPSSKAVCPGRATKVFASELRPSLHIRIFAPTSQRLRATVLFLPAAKPKISFAENGTTPVNAVVPFLMQVTKQSIAVGFVILQTSPCSHAPSTNTQSLHRSQPPRQLRPPLALISPPDYVLSLSCPPRLERLACPISWVLSIWFTRVSTLMFGLTI